MQSDSVDVNFSHIANNRRPDTPHWLLRQASFYFDLQFFTHLVVNQTCKVQYSISRRTAFSIWRIRPYLHRCFQRRSSCSSGCSCNWKMSSEKVSSLCIHLLSWSHSYTIGSWRRKITAKVGNHIRFVVLPAQQLKQGLAAPAHTWNPGKFR